MNEILDYFKGDDLAASVWQKKYALRDENENIVENTPNDMHRRLAKGFAKIEQKYDSSLKPELKLKLSNYGYNRSSLSEEDIFNLFKNFKYIIPGGSVMYGLGQSKPISLSNCFVTAPPKDSMIGIFKTCAEQASLFKRRGGDGYDISSLRPNQAKVNNSAHYSTGSVSFMDLFSQVTKTVGELNRRGALLLSIFISHPDAEEFILKKQDLRKVTKANVSIQMLDDFMEAVIEDKDYIQKFPIDSTFNVNLDECKEYNKLYSIKIDENICYFKKVKARELWHKFVHCAWNTAEPGLIYHSRMINYSPDGLYPKYRMISTNPCVTADTTLLTPEGFVKIGDVVDKKVTIWNGWEWCNLIPFKTSDNAEIFLVKFSDGSELKCTNYHKFILYDNKRKELKELKIGDKLVKWNLPKVKIEKEYSKEIYSQYYTQGFWQGDGSKENNPECYIIDLYNKKQELIPYLYCKVRNKEVDDDSKTRIVVEDLISKEKNYIPFDKENIYKLAWLGGIIDSDGSVNEQSGSISVSSIDKQFLNNIQKLLITLGIKSKVLDEKEECKKLIKGKEYNCQNSYRLLISSYNVKALHDLGLITYRVNSNVYPKRESEHFVKIVSIESIGFAPTYCVNEEKNHSCLFNSIVTANCGEIGMGSYDSCRLIHINLTSVIKNPFTNKAEIDEELLYKLAYETLVLGDNLVDLEIEAINKIIETIKLKDADEEIDLWENINKTAKETRRCGAGFTGLADAIAMLNIKYCSEESFKYVENIMRIIFSAQLDATIDLGILRGPFEGYDKSLEIKGNDWFSFVEKEFPNQYNRMMLYGRRNISFSTVAPTGTVSLLARCSSGIEPVFLALYKRNVKCNSDSDRIDFIDGNGEKYTSYIVIHPALKEWAIKNVFFSLSKEEIDSLSFEKWEDVLNKSPWKNATASEISWMNRVKMQGLIQKYITHSISSTINLPKETTEEEIEKIFLEAWKFGNKGQTVYRDGCRDGVLNSIKKEKPKELIESKAPKRPDELEADYYEIKSKGIRYAILVGIFDNKPYEIFAFELNQEDANLKQHKGKIIKIGKMHYRFVSDLITIKNLQLKNENVEEKAATLYSSMLLRHGVNIKYIIKTAKKVNDNIASFSSAICRVLSKYIPKEELKNEKCPECGGRLVREGSCIHCIDCGYSKCL